MTAPRSIRCLNEWHGINAVLFQGDCVEVLRQIPDNSVDMQVFSPPFANVYTYSDSTRDMGNVESDTEFIASYRHLVRELYRVLRPGRICAVHCKDLVYYRSSSERGTAGLRDFPGDLVRAHVAEGFDLHSKVTIWKDPVVEQRKSNAHGLLYKQLRADSSVSRQGCAEYLMVFRKYPRNEAEEAMIRPVTHTKESFPLHQWQQWASPVWKTDDEIIPEHWREPVWMDVDQTNVLNVAKARDDRDEKHMCPLQLDVIERAVKLWSNKGDVVLSPFAGIGSEGHGALTYGRRYVGIELKESYFRTAIQFLDDADRPRQSLLFAPN